MNQVNVEIDEQRIIRVVGKPWHQPSKLFHSPTGESFARLEFQGHMENWPLDSQGFRERFERIYYCQYRSMPTPGFVNNALRELSGEARFASPECQVSLRVAEHGGNFYLDLCDSEWRAVEVTTQGWSVVTDLPVRFQRKPGMLPLPEPVRGGDVKELRQFLHLDTSEQEILLLAWLMSAYRATGPYPILALHGPQGAAKSTAALVLRRLVDPSKAPLRSASRDERDLSISADHAHLLGFDNFSRIGRNLSDAFCRLATGSGFATRRLHSDADQVIFAAQRPILLNGIESLSERGDLLDRMLVLHLTRIADNERRPESEFWADFEVAQPRILGALLDVVSAALRKLPLLKPNTLPRMADFAKWAMACEEPLGFKPGDFMRAYDKNRTESSLAVLEGSPAILELAKMMAIRSKWEGTHQELLVQLKGIASADVRRDPRWPRSAKGLSSEVARAEVDLKAAKVSVERLNREGGTGRRRIRLFRMP